MSRSVIYCSLWVSIGLLCGTTSDAQTDRTGWRFSLSAGPPLGDDERLQRRTAGGIADLSGLNAHFGADAAAGIDDPLAQSSELSSDLRFSIVANYVDAQRMPSSALSPIGIDSINVASQRWSAPANVAFSMSF